MQNICRHKFVFCLKRPKMDFKSIFGKKMCTPVKHYDQKNVWLLYDDFFCYIMTKNKFGYIMTILFGYIMTKKNLLGYIMPKKKHFAEKKFLQRKFIEGGPKWIF